MKKNLIFLFILIPALLFSQGGDSPEFKKSLPAQAIHSNKLRVQNIYFTKIIDYKGRGEVLEVQFSLKNLSNDILDLYIFAIATYEVEEPPYSSFNIPEHPRKKIRSFVPYPENLPNFEYPVKDKNGNIVKDEKGNEMKEFVKYPHDPKLGFDMINSVENPLPYRLDKSLIIRTKHLSKYRNDYLFFNEVTLLIFDKDGKPLFRQLYQLKGKRR